IVLALPTRRSTSRSTRLREARGSRGLSARRARGHRQLGSGLVKVSLDAEGRTAMATDPSQVALERLNELMNARADDRQVMATLEERLEALSRRVEAIESRLAAIFD